MEDARGLKDAVKDAINEVSSLLAQEQEKEVKERAKKKDDCDKSKEMSLKLARAVQRFLGREEDLRELIGVEVKRLLAEEEAEPAEHAEEPFVVRPDFSKEVRGLLGAGGFGRVQLVEGEAWKAAPKAFHEKSGFKESLMWEKLVLGATLRCPCPFIMKYHGCCHTAKYVYFKVEALLGGELYTVYKKEKLWGSEAHARYFLACTLTALEHLHSLRVMLRSLKLEDCVLSATGVLKLVDFGLSKFIVDKTFTTCGTPDYFSPEVISATGHSFPVDWWCAGVMLFELLAETAPFSSATPMQIYSKVLGGIQRADFSPVGEEAKDLICGLCAQQPEERLPEKQGFDAVRRHGFFKGLDWQGLGDMTPPYRPPSAAPLSNFNVQEDDLNPGFGSVEIGAPSCSQWWAQHFGPQLDGDEFAEASVSCSLCPPLGLCQ